jgi:hypothetical protein
MFLRIPPHHLRLRKQQSPLHFLWPPSLQWPQCKAHRHCLHLLRRHPLRLWLWQRARALCELRGA